VRTPARSAVRLWADGQVADQRDVLGSGFLMARFGDSGWHPLLLESATRGLRLGEISVEPS
jgi:hypothetical protein